MLNHGAGPALAGYRKQLLYTLHCILKGERLIKLEGKEDLDIYDEAGTAPEVLIQVKALVHALRLSDLLSSTSDRVRPGFLERFVAEASQNPTIKGRLISFGPIGPQI